MIDYSHPARHAHHVERMDVPSSWSHMAFDATGRTWTTGGTVYSLRPAGRGAHRPAPVSLVKSYV